RVWNLADGSAQAVLPAFGRNEPGLSKGVAAIAVTGDGARFVAISEGGGVKLWERAGWREILVMPGGVHRYERPILAVGFDGTRAVAGPSYGFREAPLYHLTVWNLQTGRAERSLSAPSAVHDEDYDSVAISSDGRHVAAGDQNGSVAMWELESGEQRLRW